MTTLSESDRSAIVAAGHLPEEALGQLARLTGPPATLRLARAATTGDGIRVLDDGEIGRLEAAHAEAAAQGRITSFVPASGAATRLCRDLLRAFQDGGDASGQAHAEARHVLEHLPDTALWSWLAEHGAREGDRASVLGAMFGPGGVELHRLPKGLVPFHPAPEGARTAFEEHLVEAVRLGKDARGLAKAHMTVGARHHGRFTQAFDDARRRIRLGAKLSVGFSQQDPSTDTIAATPSGDPFITSDGRVLYRPGGHGALLGNLDALQADIVLVKNIDNVVPEDLRGPILPWRRRLSGLLVTLQGRAWELVRCVRRGHAHAEARAFLAAELGLADVPDDQLEARLHRPWRVAGMVRNEGQPGGGPFWAASPDGVGLQIVEGAQIDHADPEQAAILASATHFNPVDMALGLLDADGSPFQLSDWTDPDAVIVTEKSHGGRPLRALEHPGLWNGGMARWNTVFVEVPASTFQPVKTMADLLRVEHGGPLC